MHESILIEVASELRVLTEKIERRIAAEQRGELFADLDGRVHLSMEMLNERVAA